MTVKDSNLPAGMSEELAAKLRAGSGETQGNYPFLPILEIDNSSVEKEVDGETVEVLCQPQWKKTTLVDGEKKVEPYAKGWGGIVLLIKYQVQKKYEPKDKATIPFFYSNEFSTGAFRDVSELITLKFPGTEQEDELLNYQQFKGKYAGKYTLWATVYVWHNKEVVRVRLKTSSLSRFWDYLKLFKGKNSVSLNGTIFDAERIKEPKPHNRAEFRIAKELPPSSTNWEEIAQAQDDLNLLFSKSIQGILETFGGEVVDAEEEISVEDVPFN